VASRNSLKLLGYYEIRTCSQAICQGKNVPQVKFFPRFFPVATMQEPNRTLVPKSPFKKGGLKTPGIQDMARFIPYNS
jgi:hypothetical protein